MKDFHIPLFPDKQYHILSRAIGDEKIFREDRNYSFFLSRYQKYISPVADTYSYCLLPNHFHFLIRIKDEQTINALQQTKKKIQTPRLSALVMQQFSNLLNSYTKSFNNTYARKGSLFIDYLRRVEIETDKQFGATIFYIHKNPVHHGSCEKMEDWKWSSYNTILSLKPTKLLRQETLDWFGGIKGFTDYHGQPVYLKEAAGIE